MRSSDSQITGFTPKAEPGSDEYKTRTAEPVMSAIDSMPAEYRALVHDFGYVEVYRAWRKGWTPKMIMDRAKECGGIFKL